VTPALPRVTFGVIVLNGMPFVPYVLRALYPFAHQLIVVEGAAPGAAPRAAPGGHSSDGTLEELRRFARDDDPEGKVVVVTAEDEGHADGIWPGEKDEQSAAYAVRATGDYLWQVDIDEFYLPEHMEAVLELLAGDPSITTVTFPTLTFWGAPRCTVDGWFLRRGAADYHRLFQWAPGYTYATHRPPTVLDERGRDLRDLHWLDARETARRGLVMYHYSLLLPAQAIEKVAYYTNWGLYGDWFAADEGRRWLEDSYLTLRRPYRVHNVYRYPSWLERFNGPHAPEAERLFADIVAGRVRAERRPMEDAERLLRSPWYVAGRELLKLVEPADREMRRLRRAAGPAVRAALGGRHAERGAAESGTERADGD
jgi:hypothetical protein